MSNKKQEVKKSSNPFEIVTNVELGGTRAPNPFCEKLVAMMIKLKAKDNKQSVFVPLTVADNKKSAQNLILGARRIIDEKYKDYVFSTRFNIDKTGENDVYLGANIWRIN